MRQSIPKPDEKYEIESAANTLIEAAKIRKNKKLMPKVLEELKKRLEATKEAQNANTKTEQ